MALASPLAAIPVKGSHLGQGRDLFAVEAPQLGQVGDQDQGGEVANAQGAGKGLFQLQPEGMLVEKVIDLLVQGRQPVLQGLDGLLNTLGDARREGGVQAVFFHLDHIHQLAPSSQKILEFLLLRCGQGTGLGPHAAGIQGHNLSIRSVLAAVPAPRAKLRTSLGLMKQAGNSASRKAATMRNS